MKKERKLTIKNDLGEYVWSPRAGTIIQNEPESIDRFARTIVGLCEDHELTLDDFRELLRIRKKGLKKWL